MKKLNNDEFSEWENFKFTLFGLVLLSVPVIAICLIGLVLFGLF